MYKVFINDTPIIITSSIKKENNFPVFLFKNVVIDEIIHKLQNNIIDGINLYSTDLKNDWNYFLENFKVVKAAGGLVLNPKNEILFIFRNNIWDLPKGHVEKKESLENAAIREVEEECGISKLLIIQKLIITYHIYYLDGLKLKETHWFLMSSNDAKMLTPQSEEGITKVVFKNRKQVLEAFENTYSNIKMVYESYLKLS
ncbi:MAG: NUDIX domain-containing protein [Flavobacteriia bacterium]|nr:NUDIX domain-containing protein [Flavobacteriia bacterium]OIP48331.1 MAG: NUDIX hydrolase [Flavobacteriaceae bacterium CG2_30_31_66]PIV96278.1 MAG: NUDIX hydrolase [Flavobacteriaceae bacterium CG17_big_fil_post_rev_8_21_14_2_50_31_13]PIX12671.1 MAG: NUDIX hydrolase [Flavobacteriaceae bacterium CG_4_8_14_3_um_filter_31_8]PIY13538.1 MAG: NUDIX hydrolase [Flavobacteriaceae bacterium CG_4_10_14_3_um_filter_31_253]PIZ09415.1 MAG: NUDIX hydrolase [Flavobacteriaceae bacterium CG_4_10_14_0_8_um_fil